MLKRRTTILVGITAMAMPLASVVTAHSAAADALSDLRSAVDTIRAASQCPPLYAEPLVMRAAQMSTEGTRDYIIQRTAAIPFDDPMPALKAIGYTGSRALMLSGYGPDATASIKGLILQDMQNKVIADCTNTQYGVSALEENGVVYTSLVLASE